MEIKMNSLVRNILKVIGVLIILTGIIWILQGTSILPGSYMTGNPQWTINGAVSVLIGAALFWFANRKK
jgi:hypothetical protein